MNKTPLIYSAEDDAGIRELLECAILASGYRVETFESAEAMLERMERKLPDLVLLDIMLPQMDGVEALRRIKDAYAGVPVILLTAKGSELNKVAGLDAGADDYVTKPFGVMELIARIRARLRKGKNGALELSGIRIDEDTRTALRDGEVLNLTVKEFDLLLYLMRRAGSVVKRDELLNEVWGYDFGGETRTLDVHIMSLRAKLRDTGEGGDYRYLATVRGVGYRFIKREL